ncbi:MAG TPA: TonB-dependent receptor [Flavobacteriaceae bacterium]|nr:TonB-dependent receptor [Flavobacteriaceae bacterium]
MKLKTIIFLFAIILTSKLSSQEIKKDSIKSNNLDEVVITGQYSKQSIKKSVFDVTVINSKTIEQNAVNNLADLLNQNLNIQIIPNAKEGKSTVSLFGLDGQYFKIMQDGIPMVSEDGFGNNIDLTQINLDNVKQIEIVEGSMGVSYGANAVSGVINIITKTGSNDDWNISISAQEETAGNEFAFFDKGKHIQKLHVAHNINDNFYISANIYRDDFAGYLGQRKGKNHFLQDNLRGYEWLPKEQITTKGLINYSKEDLRITYKVGFFKAFLNKYDAAVVRVNNTTTGVVDLLSLEDNDFLTNRMSHDIIVNSKIGKRVNFNFYSAYQEQIKKVRRVIYNLNLRTPNNAAYKNYLYRKTYFSKAIFNHFTTNKPFDFELGIEYNLVDGFGSSVASIINTVDIKEKFSNFDMFASAEYNIGDRMLFRPGIRYSIQSKFKNQFQYSLSSRYLLKNNFTLRNVIGSSYRTPTFDELYTYFVDGTHNVTGNENLISERSYSINTTLKKVSYFNKGKLTNKLKIGFLNVKDRIDLAVVYTEPELAYKYINVDNHTSVDYSLENKLQYKAISIQLNGTLLGVSQNTNNIQESKDFLYTLILNSNLSYYFKKINSSFNVSYKYNGEQSEFLINSDGDLVKNTLNSYSWMDASFKTSFLKKKLETTMGARNLFNVVRVNSSYTNSSNTHSINSGSRLMGYGRSYFIKLKYKLNI